MSSDMGSESQDSQMLRLVTEESSGSGGALSKPEDAYRPSSPSDIPESMPTDDRAIHQYHLYSLGESQSQHQGDDNLVGGYQKENMGSAGSGSSQGGSQMGSLARARALAKVPPKSKVEMAPPPLRTSYARKSPQPRTAERGSRSPHPTTTRSRVSASRSNGHSQSEDSFARPGPQERALFPQLFNQPLSDPKRPLDASQESQDFEMGDADWARNSPSKDAHTQRFANRKNSIVPSETSDESQRSRSHQTQQSDDHFSQVGRQTDDGYDELPLPDIAPLHGRSSESQASSHASSLRLYADRSRDDESEDEYEATQPATQPTQPATQPTQLATPPPECEATQLETQPDTQPAGEIVPESTNNTSAPPQSEPLTIDALFSMTANQIRSHGQIVAAPSRALPSAAPSQVPSVSAPSPAPPHAAPASALPSASSNASSVVPLGPPPPPAPTEASNASAFSRLFSMTEAEVQAEIRESRVASTASTSTTGMRRTPRLWDTLSKEKQARMKPPPPARPAASSGSSAAPQDDTSVVATAGSSAASSSDRAEKTQTDESTQPAGISQPAQAAQSDDALTQPANETQPADDAPVDDTCSSQEVRSLLSSPERPLWQQKRPTPLTPSSEARARSPVHTPVAPRLPLGRAVADSTPQRPDDEVPDSEPMRDPVLERRDVPGGSEDKMDVDEEEEQEGDVTVQAINAVHGEEDRARTEHDEEDRATEPASEPEGASSDFEQSIPLMDVMFAQKAKKEAMAKGKGRAYEDLTLPKPKGKGKQRAMPPPRVTRAKRQRVAESEEEDEDEEEEKPPSSTKPARRATRGSSKAASGSRIPSKAPPTRKTRSAAKKAKEEEVVEDSELESERDLLPDVQQLTDEPEEMSDYDAGTTSGQKRKRVIKHELTGLSRSSRSARTRTASMTPGPSMSRTPSGSAAQLLALSQATRVFARWKPDGNYYSGVVKRLVRANTYNIRFDDGSTADVLLKDMRLFLLRPGDEVLVRGKRSFVVDTHRMFADGCVRVNSPDDETEEGEGEDLSLEEFCIAAKVIVSSWAARRVLAENIRPEEDLTGSVLAPSPSRSSLRSVQEPGRGVLDRIAFVLTHSSDPGAKDSFEKVIVANGGVVLACWDEVLDIPGTMAGAGSNARWIIQRDACGVRHRSTYDKLFLLSASDTRTTKFLTALACGVPCVKQEWVTESLVQNRLQDWRQYLLPQGLSVTYNMSVTQMVDTRWGDNRAHLLDLLDGNTGKLRLLEDMSIALVGRDLMPRANAASSKAEPGVAKVLICMGARRVEVFAREQAIVNRLSNYDLVILRTGESTPTTRPASLRRANVCSWDWAKDCLSLSRLLPYTWPADD